MTAQSIKITLLTLAALIAFAANSVLCRLALNIYQMDAASFTSIRLFSGALMLIFMLLWRAKSHAQTPHISTQDHHWLGAIMLFIYATCFSYAYISLDAATGALILFLAVQITMISLAIFTGYRLHMQEWLGLVLALTGFVYLILPNMGTPSLSGFILMLISGIAWGVYSHLGRCSKHPTQDTTNNFIKTIPMIAALMLFTLSQAQFNAAGITIAILSGAIASALGYILWYAALAHLSATQASVVQLGVPIIAALGGVLFLSESISMRLGIASLMMLTGIAFVILTKAKN